MRKALSIALILVTATIAVPAASADPTLGERIIAQETARAGDPALFGPSSTPVQIVGPADDFDLRDAGIGGVLALAVSLLAAALLTVRNGSRVRTATPES